MKVTTSLIPSIVWYTCYENCTIADALLHSLQNAKNNTLSLCDIGNIKVNGNRLIGSYGKNIQNLRRKGYDIEMVQYHNRYKNITEVTYTLNNPSFSPDSSEQFNNI